MASSRAPAKPAKTTPVPTAGPLPAPRPVAARRSGSPNFWRWVIVGLLASAVLAGVMVWRALNRNPAEVFIVQRGTATAAVYGTVKIQPNVTREIRAQNTGFIRLESGIQSGVVSVGSEVKSGQLLATIVDDVNERALRQAQTDLAAALERQKLGPPSAQLVRTAKDSLGRLERLSANTVPAADLERARSELKRLTDEVNAQTVDLQRQVDTYQGIVAGIQEQLKRTQLRAPMDGLLTAVAPADGDLIQNNTLLFTVATKGVYVEGQVNEEDVGEIKDGMRADLRLYSYSKREFVAKVSSVLPSTTPENQRYTVISYLENPPDNIRSGMTGEMNIIIARREGALVMPARALMTDQVLIVEDGVVKPRTVKVGYRGFDMVEISEGINEGDSVIVSDQETFRPASACARSP